MRISASIGRKPARACPANPIGGGQPDGQTMRLPARQARGMNGGRSDNRQWPHRREIVIAGAGSIGCYVGGCLALAGRNVTFLARPRIAAACGPSGLRVTDLDGRDRAVAGGCSTSTEDPADAFADAGIVLVTVKSGATDEMAALDRPVSRRPTRRVSLQNGVEQCGAHPGRACRPASAGCGRHGAVQCGADRGPAACGRTAPRKARPDRRRAAGLAGTACGSMG